MRPKVKRLIWIAPAALLGAALFASLGGLLVRELWNWLLPPIFGWKLITFWQALGLLLLCRILFGHHGFSGSGKQNKCRPAALTPQERESIRDRINAHDPV